MYEKETNVQDSIPVILNGKFPNGCAIFALRTCFQLDEEIDKRKSEPPRSCCTAICPEKTVCCGSTTRTWGWTNRTHGNQYSYPTSYQNCVRECLAQYCCCATCRSRRREYIEEKNCNKQVETTVTWPCCYCTQLASENSTKKALENKRDCRNVGTQYNPNNDEIVQGSIHGTGDSQLTKQDTAEQVLREPKYFNDISNEPNQKEESEEFCMTQYDERSNSQNGTHSISSKNRDERRSSSDYKNNKQNKSKTEQVKSTIEHNISGKSDKKQASQLKLRKESITIENFKGNQSDDDTNEALKETLEGSATRRSNEARTSIPKFVNNIDDYANSKNSKISSRSNSSDKNVKPMLHTPNSRRVAESKFPEKNNKFTNRKGELAMDMNKSNNDKSNKRNGVYKSETTNENIKSSPTSNERKVNGLKGAEKTGETINTKDFVGLDVNKSYILNTNNSKNKNNENNDNPNGKKDTTKIFGKTLQGRNKINNNPDKSSKIYVNDKTKEMQSSKRITDESTFREAGSIDQVNNIEQIGDSELTVMLTNHDDPIDAHINKSYVIISNNDQSNNDKNKPPTKKEILGDEDEINNKDKYYLRCICCCCCCCRYYNNIDNINTAQQTGTESNVICSTSKVNVKDSDTGTCSCATCSCTSSTEDEVKQQSNSTLNQKQKRKYIQNGNAAMVKKQACKRKVECTKQNKMNTIFTENLNQGLETVSVSSNQSKGVKANGDIAYTESISSENTIQNYLRNYEVSLENTKNYVQSSNKPTTYACLVCPCCGAKLDGALDFAANKTKQFNTEHELDIINNTKGYKNRKNSQIGNVSVDKGTQNGFKVINCSNIRTKYRCCDCYNDESFEKDINSQRRSLVVNNNSDKNNLYNNNTVNQSNSLYNKKKTSADVPISYPDMVSRSTEVDVGPDTIQQARQRTMNA